MAKKQWKPALGMTVTSTVRQSAYYFEDSVFFHPGDTGVIGAIDVPAVRAPVVWVGDKKTYPRGRNPVFACVDFIHNGQKYRTHFYYDQLKEIKP